MNSKPEELRERTKSFAVRVFKMYGALPRTEQAHVAGKQLLRCASSVAANYRAACRARTKAEFVSKLGIVVEEADESVFWIELMVETDILPAAKLTGLLTEARELTAIFTASRKTARE